MPGGRRYVLRWYRHQQIRFWRFGKFRPVMYYKLKDGFKVEFLRWDLIVDLTRR